MRCILTVSTLYAKLVLAGPLVWRGLHAIITVIFVILFDIRLDGQWPFSLRVSERYSNLVGLACLSECIRIHSLFTLIRVSPVLGEMTI